MNSYKTEIPQATGTEATIPLVKVWNADKIPSDILDDPGKTMMTPKVDIPIEKIEAFCKKWKIIEFSLFGSVLRDDFRADSDVDVLVTFEKGTRYTLFDMMDMEDELKSIFNRGIDFVEEECLVNPFRRREIIRTKKVIYAA